MTVQNEYLKELLEVYHDEKGRFLTCSEKNDLVNANLISSSNYCDCEYC